MYQFDQGGADFGEQADILLTGHWLKRGKGLVKLPDFGGGQDVQKTIFALSMTMNRATTK